MKRITIMNKLTVLLVFAFVSVNTYSQGFYVYTKDGQKQDYPQENVDSIVFYGKTENSGQTNIINGHEYVDLGLSVKWATCNVGADSPEEYGDYYAWGETTTKSSYDVDNSVTCGFSCFGLESRGIIGSDGNLTAAYDVATVKWGSRWRMPTLDEFKELLYGCIWTWTTQNGVKGLKVTGANGNSIFLPAAGMRSGSSLYYAGKCGYYWSSAPNESYPFDACGLEYSSEYCQLAECLYRYCGLSVRPVTE